MNKFIEESVSPFHVVNNVKNLLKNSGFKELKLNEKYTEKNIQRGGKYFVNLYDSSLMAFTIGEKVKNSIEDENNSSARLRITSSHTDFPGFKVKPNSIMSCENIDGISYLKINTEVYGGAILNTWLDRPLGLAGRFIIKNKDAFNSRQLLVKSKENAMLIPNLAIHMNREVNKGVELNKQKEMLPVFAIVNSEENKEKDLIKIIFAKQLEENNIQYEDVVDYELYVFNCDKGGKVGVNDEMFSSPRLDNLTSVFAQTDAIINSNRDEGINVAFYYDNEEIGSKSKQGAASQISMLLLEKIYEALGFDRQFLINDILSGVMVSVDVAHATHPNYPEKSDPTNRIMLNNGIVIKLSASQSYSNDGFSTALVKQLCDENDIKYQLFVNKSDMVGGQTLGAISSTVLPLRTLDIGIPLLSMHSSRELMGCKDQKYLEKFLTVYYS